jgi:tetratricopeptide (TPR) repeat protein
LRSVGAYSLGDVARICRVSPARLRYWERTALLDAGGGDGRRSVFGFHDLRSVKALLGLLEQGVPLRRIRGSLEALRARMPDVERPLGALRVWHKGSPRVVVRHQGVLVEPDGQTVLDFAEADRGVAEVAPLAMRIVARGSRGPRTAEEWFQRGCRIDSDPASYEDAVEAYTRAIAIDPHFADAYCNLGSVFYNQGRRAQAQTCFERAVALDADCVEARLNLATLLEENGYNGSALRHYKIALRGDPWCADTHLSLALLYGKLELPGAARRHWRRYLQIEPQGSWSDVAQRHLDG